MYTQIKALAQGFTNMVFILPYDVTELPEGLRLEVFEKNRKIIFKKSYLWLWLEFFQIVGAVGKLRSRA